MTYDIAMSTFFQNKIPKNTAFAIFMLKTVDDCILVCYNFVYSIISIDTNF